MPRHRHRTNPDNLLDCVARKPLQIELATTTDDANGACPPVGDGWVVARSGDGRTMWRRIYLERATP